MKPRDVVLAIVAGVLLVITIATLLYAIPRLVG
jgi:hypothetical protein